MEKDKLGDFMSKREKPLSRRVKRGIAAERNDAVKPL